MNECVRRRFLPPHSGRRLGVRNLTALSPLVYHHVNPYGCFELDLDTRILLDNAGEKVVLAT